MLHHCLIRIALLLVLVQTGFSAETTIVITPTGNEEPLEQSTGTVTVISAREIDAHGYTNLAQALNGVPGIHLATTGPRGQLTSLFARGTNSDHTLVMRDGLVLNDPSSPAGAFNFSMVNLSDVEQIEVVRGPLSTLYGSGAIGAVVNLITASGKTGPRGRFSLAAGNVGNLESALTFSNTSTTLDYRLTLTHQRGDGETAAYHRDTYNNLNQISEADGFKNTAGSATLGWRWNDATWLDIHALIKRTHTELDQFLFEDPDWTFTNQEHALQAQLTHSPLDANWKARFGLSRYSIKRHSNNPRQITTQNRIDTTHIGKRTQVDARFDYLGRKQHRFALIAAWQRESISASGFSVYGSKSGDYSVSEDTHANTDNVSLALQDEWTSNAGQSLTASVRLDKHRDFGSHFTWLLAGQLPIANKRGRFRFTFGTGFKAPSLYELHGHSATNFGNSYQGNPNLSPEETFSLEAGIDYRFSSGAQISASFYKMHIRNLIQTIYDAQFNSTSENVARAKISGAELALTYPLGKHLTLKANYSYTDAKNTKNKTRLVRRPRHQANITFDFQASEYLSLWTQYQYVADRYDINPASDADPSTNDAFIKPADYNLLSVGFNYHVHKALVFFTRIDNLTNEDYEPIAGYRGSGIQGLIGIRVDF